MTTKTPWTVGVTTVSSRRETTLPRTMASLCDGGFKVDRLFVDDCEDPSPYKEYGCDVTCRDPRIRTHGNWVLALYELFIRQPNAAHFAIFQDDLICYNNLREYLDRVEKPRLGYLNLYTFPVNQQRAPNKTGWFESNQLGKGAVGLVFSNQAVEVLLTHPHMFGRPRNAARGWRAVDGGIVDSFRKSGWKEYCHNPSLIQHIGTHSSMGNPTHLEAPSFRGEDFDALQLLGEK